MEQFEMPERFPQREEIMAIINKFSVGHVETISEMNDGHAPCTMKMIDKDTGIIYLYMRTGHWPDFGASAVSSILMISPADATDLYCKKIAEYDSSAKKWTLFDADEDGVEDKRWMP